MEFRDNGEVSFQIAGRTFTLGNPTIGQINEYEELHNHLRQAALDQLQEWTTALEGADDYEAETIRAQMSDRNWGLSAINEPWLRKAFDALGSESLPDDLSNAPGDLVSSSLIPGIIRHWRSDPLARSRLRRQ